MEVLISFFFMKKIFAVVIVGISLAFPLSVSAATLGAGQQYSLLRQQVVVGSAYVAAGTTTIGGRVTGDVVAAGGTVIVSGSVGEDIAVIGGTVQVLGPIGGDVRVIGGTVTIADSIGGDLVALGGTVHILPNAVITGDVIIAGGQLIIDGSVQGSITYRGGTLMLNGSVDGSVSAKVQDHVELGSTAVIKGGFMYGSSREATIAEGARILGATAYEPAGKIEKQSEAPARVMWAMLGVLTGMRLIAVIGLTILLVWRWRRETLDVLSGIREGFWQAMGRGLAFMVLIPVAVVLLMISFVGVLPGALLLMAFVGMVIVTKALTGIFFGSWVYMMFKKREVLHISWGSAIGGVIALELLSSIPVLGWIGSAALWLAVFGVVSHQVQKIAR